MIPASRFAIGRWIGIEGFLHFQDIESAEVDPPIAPRQQAGSDSAWA